MSDQCMCRLNEGFGLRSLVQSSVLRTYNKFLFYLKILPFHENFE